MNTETEHGPLDNARRLAALFGANPAEVEVPVGDSHGWGWADAALAATLPPDLAGGNPYEYGAYDSIRADWAFACRAIEEQPTEQHIARVRELLAAFQAAIRT